ncbi:hypothetical protein GCM10007415_28580 [Parapedobacter pyrenivorans]|uniref:FecR family protein n=1 Tax=Parapedobacter pyrenivorans TaxID=1305674 RepID=A0A917HW68_9SPHI|nr:FecR family protein [Parapedobacter pyrenivorans]GGG92126.1 hypothetical protein GCM10007415_28580 [Parapedobacter pyrenivorans]
MTRERLQFLYEQYQRRLISDDELAELRLFVSDDLRHQLVEEWLDGIWDDLDEGTLSDIPRDRQRLLLESIISDKPVVKRIRLTWWYAAAIALLLTGGILIFQYVEQAQEKSLLALGTGGLKDISPGANKAILTLPNGSKIVLDDIDSGELVADNSVRMTKSADGILVYESIKMDSIAAVGERVSYHTVSTPAGGQYQIWLPDGTKVTLNAGSELRYPVVFQRDKRMVTFQGEGYFEVAPDAKRPFLVESVTPNGRQTIAVLGTEFNVNTYDREQEIRTAVIKGSVEVRFSTAIPSVVLKPGHQSVLAKKDGNVSLSVAKADLNSVAAWKDGLFVFADEPLPDLLKRVSRWYNVTFSYDDDMHDVRIQGNYFRNKGLLDLLQNLELIGKIDFLIEQPAVRGHDERRIYVKKR